MNNILVCPKKQSLKHFPLNFLKGSLYFYFIFQTKYQIQFSKTVLPVNQQVRNQNCNTSAACYTKRKQRSSDPISIYTYIYEQKQRTTLFHVSERYNNFPVLLYLVGSRKCKPVLSLFAVLLSQSNATHTLPGPLRYFPCEAPSVEQENISNSNMIAIGIFRAAFMHGYRTIRPRTIHPTDNSPADNSPTDNSPIIIDFL